MIYKILNVIKKPYLLLNEWFDDVHPVHKCCLFAILGYFSIYTNLIGFFVMFIGVSRAYYLIVDKDYVG